MMRSPVQQLLEAARRRGILRHAVSQHSRRGMQSRATPLHPAAIPLLACQQRCGSYLYPQPLYYCPDPWISAVFL